MQTNKDSRSVLKLESVKDSILKALDNRDIESASELLNYWESHFPIEGEERSIFLYTKLQVLLRCYNSTEDNDSKTVYLRNAIETGNQFFSANEEEGFPMDTEVQKMWYVLVDLSAEFLAFYLEGIHEDDYAGEELEDSFEEPEVDILTEAIYKNIGKVNKPNFKPKPPRKYDDSLPSRLLKAIDTHIKEYGDFDAKEFHLLESICKELGIPFEDFFNSIYDY